MSTGPRGGKTRGSWDNRKRRTTTASDDSSSGIELAEFFRSALVLQPSMHTYDLDFQQERLKLADAMWVPDGLFGEFSTAAANSELSSFLDVLLRNRYHPADPERADIRKRFRLEGLLADLQRAQSQKQMPILTARLSVACYRAQLPRRLWHLLAQFFPGMLASYEWTKDLVACARAHRPPCPYETLPYVGGTMFDNYTRKVLYSSQVTVDNHGYLLNMTNWATMAIPKVLAPANFDAARVCECAHAQVVSSSRISLTTASPSSQG